MVVYRIFSVLSNSSNSWRIGLPCIAARQKEKATNSVSELVQIMKRPRALSESASRPSVRKSGFAEEEKQSLQEEEEEEEEEEKEKAEKILRRKSESGASIGRKSEGGNKISMQRISEVSENKLKNSQRRSFMRYILLF